MFAHWMKLTIQVLRERKKKERENFKILVVQDPIEDFLSVPPRNVKVYNQHVPNIFQNVFLPIPSSGEKQKVRKR